MIVYTQTKGIKLKFYKGVKQFIIVTCQTQQFISEGNVRCSYGKHSCRKYFNIESIGYHLYKYGLKPDYWVWIEHEEVVEIVNQFGMDYVEDSFSGVHIGGQDMGNMTWKNNFSCYQEIISDATSLEFGMCS